MTSAMTSTNGGLIALDADLWVVSRPLALAVGDVGCRMTVVRLPDGGLVLHSPVANQEGLAEKVQTLGEPRYLVAPNLVHHLFLDDWTTQFPEAKVCAPLALARKHKGLAIAHELGASDPPSWAGALATQKIRGAPLMQETALLHRPSRTLIVADLTFNVVSGKTEGGSFFWRLVGARDRFGPHRLIRLGFRDQHKISQSLEAIMQWDFDRIIMSHGEVIDSGGKDLMAEAFERWLPA